MSRLIGLCCAVLSLGLLVVACETPLSGSGQQAGLAPVPLPQAEQHFVVFFELWSADLGSDAKPIIARALAASKYSTLPVRVIGYADPEGTAAQNEKLSADRAKAVADALIAGGLAADRVTQESVGSIGYVSDPQEARRVVIAIGPSGPGAD